MIRLNRSTVVQLGFVLCAFCSPLFAQRGVGGISPDAAPQKWAVIIGVGQYDDAAISDLPNAVNDAQAVRDRLVAMDEGFPEANVLLLADGAGDAYAPTRTNMMKYLSSFLSLAAADDTVLVYFAGHGVTEGDRLYLLLRDAAMQNVAFSGLPFGELENLLKNAPVKKKILILDACHAGTGRGTGDQFSKSAMAEIERASSGMVTLASCSADELSHEMPDTGHGAFTYFLLDALTGKADRDSDNLISASEAAYYTWDQTRRWAALKGFTQNPWRREEGAGEIILAKPLTAGPGLTPQRPTMVQPTQPPLVIVTTGQPKPGDVQTLDLGGGVTLELVWCPPGTFMMGSPESEPEQGSKETQHQVTLSKGFWMGKYEVTQEQWKQVMGSNPSFFTGDARLPVEQVSWKDCQEFIDKLNSRVSGGGFRLPTEAQWEYACRAGTTTRFSFGQNLSTEQANYNGNYASGNMREGVYRRKTTVVGNFPANSWALHDMHGNIREWCSDWYDRNFYGQSPECDPENTTESEARVLRGGDWCHDPWVCRSAGRFMGRPPDRDNWIGFRVVHVPAP